MKSIAVLASVLVILSLAAPALAYERDVPDPDGAGEAVDELRRASERLMEEHLPGPASDDDPDDGRDGELPAPGAPSTPNGNGVGPFAESVFCGHIQVQGHTCPDTAAAPAEEPDTETAPEPEPLSFIPMDLLGEAAPESPEKQDVKGVPSGLVGAIEALLQPVHEAGEAAKRAVTETVATIGFVFQQTAAFAEYQLTTTIAHLQNIGDKFLRDLTDDGTSTIQRDRAATVQTQAATETAAPAAAAGLTIAAVGGLGLLVGGFAVLRRLIGLGSVSLLSRIPSKDIMKNDTRAAIFDIVTNDPGVSLNEIVSRLGISRNAVAYHLAVFESEHSVVSVKDGKYRRYFVNGGKYVNGAKDVVSTIKNDVTLNVIRYILDHPGVIQKDVCQAVGTSPSATNWHITRLEKVGLVAKEKVANTVRYSPGPSFQKYDLGEFGLQTPAPVSA